MSIAVFDILQLSIFNKFSLIAGNRGLNNTVRSVNVLDFEFDLMKDPTHPRCRFDKDGFVVTSFLFAKESPQDIIKTVEWLIEDGVSGLAIRDVYFKTLGQEITDLADREGFPIFIFDKSAGPIEKIVMLIDERIKQSESIEEKETKLKNLVNQKLPPAEVRKIALELNPKFEDNCFAVFVQAKQRLSNIYIRHKIGQLRHRLADRNGLFGYDNGFMIIVTSNNQFPGNINKTAERILYDYGFQEDEYYAAISSSHTLINELDLCISESQYAMQYCKLTGNEIISFNEIGIYQVIFPYLDDIWFHNFYQQIMMPILEHDAKYNSELLKTAEKYIRQSGNINLTSEKLALHQNSVRYRLSKIKDICNINERADFYEQLSVAIKLHSIYNK